MRSMVRPLPRVAILGLVIATLAWAGTPAPAPAQDTLLEDIVFRSLEVTAEIKPVTYRESCTPGDRVPGLPPPPPVCRVLSFGSVVGKTVAQLQVTSPTPVSTVRMFIEPSYRLRVAADVPVTLRREPPYFVLIFNPALRPGATLAVTFEYDGETFPVYEEFIWVGAGDLYPILISPFDDFYSANRGTVKTTITIPARYQLASSGRVTRQERGAMQVYQWETVERVANVSVIGGNVFRSLERKAGDLTLSLLLKSRDDRFADKIAEYAQRSAEYYGTLLFPFPFNQLTVVSAPLGRGLLGVAFPGSMLITEDAFTGGLGRGYDRDSYRLLVVAHEAAHTYFPYQVSGRGIAERWLSEGFAEYLGLMTVENMLGPRAFRLELDEDRAWYARASRSDRPLGSYTWINRGPEYPGVIYAKGAFILHMLRFVVGPETFERILKAYATRYRDQSVRVDDFARTASEVAGRDLTWYFQQWIYDRVLPDYTITDITSAPAEDGFRTTVRVRNAGSGRMPVDVLLELEGGEKVSKRVEVGSGTTVGVTEATPRRVIRAEVDPEKWLLQSNYTNDAATAR